MIDNEESMKNKNDMHNKKANAKQSKINIKEKRKERNRGSVQRSYSQMFQ